VGEAEVERGGGLGGNDTVPPAWCMDGCMRNWPGLKLTLTTTDVVALMYGVEGDGAGGDTVGLMTGAVGCVPFDPGAGLGVATSQRLGSVAGSASLIADLGVEMYRQRSNAWISHSDAHVTSKIHAVDTAGAAAAVSQPHVVVDAVNTGKETTASANGATAQAPLCCPAIGC